MRPHPRIRKTIKWGGLVVSCVLFILFAVATTYRVAYTTYAGYWVGMEYGQAGIGYSENYVPPPGVPGARVINLKPEIRWETEVINKRGFRVFLVPLWLPFVLAALPTAFAWRLDTLATRRAKLGACPTCSYPRTGLGPSSPCPECGAAAPQA
ncbi:MAG TPA: hypothetical protein VHN77_06725 [Phycisphaerales bacterium]|nr:hypothetical protein [Phycisphaerales bacterium]